MLSNIFSIKHLNISRIFWDIPYIAQVSVTVVRGLLHYICFYSESFHCLLNPSEFSINYFFMFWHCNVCSLTYKAGLLLPCEMHNPVWVLFHFLIPLPVSSCSCSPLFIETLIILWIAIKHHFLYKAFHNITFSLYFCCLTLVWHNSKCNWSWIISPRWF